MLKSNFLRNTILFLAVACLLSQAKQSPQATPAPQQSGDAPVSIGLLLDNSKSMAPKRNEMAAALKKLVEASNAQDEFFVVNFSDSPYLDQDFTSDRGLIEKALEHPAPPRGTAFYDAAGSSSEHLRKSAKYRKRALVIASDGEDNESHVTSQKLLQELQQPGAPVVYAIDMGDSGSEKGASLLEKMAKQTHGMAFRLKKTKHLDDVIAQIALEIRKQS